MTRKAMTSNEISVTMDAVWETTGKAAIGTIVRFKDHESVMPGYGFASHHWITMHGINTIWIGAKIPIKPTYTYDGETFDEPNWGVDPDIVRRAVEYYRDSRAVDSRTE